MKDKILMFIIGALVGAILTAGGFLLFGNSSSNDEGNRGGMQGERGQFDENAMGEGRPGDMNDIDINNIPETDANNEATT